MSISVASFLFKKEVKVNELIEFIYPQRINYSLLLLLLLFRRKNLSFNLSSISNFLFLQLI